MRNTKPLNNGWHFHEEFHPGLTATPAKGQLVQLPHNAVDIPANYFDESCCHRIFCYQNTIEWQPEFQHKRVSIRFDGIMANAHVYINGQLADSHGDGYTPLEADITDLLHSGDNLISVVLDGRENPDLPPFGGQIDYLTYAGIYRDAWIVIRDEMSIGSVKIETLDVFGKRRTLQTRCRLHGNIDEAAINVRLLGPDGTTVAERTVRIEDNVMTISLEDIADIKLWDLDSPTLYRTEVSLVHPRHSDCIPVMTGFRSCEFRSDGFFLNGRHLKIRGLNRHQSYPYIGYAMGRRAQERDAETLRNALGCNLARTSHYPQSPWFLDHCDRIGLLVFEEAPGWQHVGGPDWQQRHLENVEAMISRDWNHPSIVLWGVRVNESADQHDLYVAANKIARELDPTRQTAGVRNITDSEMLEDVYTMNDFIMGDEILPWVNRPRTALRPQAEVTGLDRVVPYMVTEFNGHMYPTKRTDNEERQIEHVTRYLEVMDHSHGEPEIAGTIGWCMFDYNTHREFGSGDRICHHGVLDMYRIPKFAAHAYASQQDPDDLVVMEPVTCWARGERSIGGVLPLIVLTNCDTVSLQYGDDVPIERGPDTLTFPNLPHPPVIFTHRDFIESEMGKWGMKWQSAKFVGYSGGKPVAERLMVADPVLTRLEILPDYPHLLASEPDDVRFLVKALDQVGNPLQYLTMPIEICVDGPARLIGPRIKSLHGGQTAFWLRSGGETGAVTVNVTTPRTGSISMHIDCLERC